MKYIWFILIAILATPAFGALYSFSGTQYIEDARIASGIPADNNYGSSPTAFVGSETGGAFLIRLTAQGFDSIPTTHRIDSMLIYIYFDSVSLLASRGDTIVEIRPARPWTEGTLNGSNPGLGVDACTWNKYLADGADDFTWTTAGARSTASDRFATAFDTDSMYTADSCGTCVGCSACDGQGMVFRLLDTVRINEQKDASIPAGFKIFNYGASAGHSIRTSEYSGSWVPKIELYTTLLATGTNQRIANGVLGMRLSAGNVGRRLKADYGN